MSITTKNYRNTLPINYQFHYYCIQAILGEGNFGITYLAQDIKLDRQVAIKEYFPKKLAVRKDKQKVHPQSAHDKELVQFGLQQFIQEGQILARLEHPNIVQILSVFESHNTGYWVMVYEQGQSLAKALENGEIATQAEIMAMLPSLLSALTTIHAIGCLHRDIKPCHIYFREKDHSPVLVDFGTARYALSRKCNLSDKVTPGYTPFEQYQNEDNQGAWTDIYALGAVLYYAITGTTPTEASTRIKAKLQNKPDPLPSATKTGDKQYSKCLLQAIHWALEVVEKDRPQTVKQWEKLIFLPTKLKQTPLLFRLNTKLFQKGEILKTSMCLLFAVYYKQNLDSRFKKWKTSKSPLKKRLTKYLILFWKGVRDVSILRITAIILIIAIIAVGTGLNHISSIKQHLAELQQQQATLEQQRLEQATLEQQRLEQKKNQAKEYFLSLLRQPPDQIPILTQQFLPLPSQEIRSLHGHQSGICVEGCLAFNPNGKLLASGSWDHTIKLWEVNTGKMLQTLQGHKNLILSIAFSPNGLLLASGSADNTIKLWEVSTGKVFQSFTEEESWIGTLAFSPNGQILAAEGANNTIRLWELSTGKILQTLIGHKNIINSVTFSTNGRVLASGSADNTIKLWQVNTGNLIKTLTGHQKEVLSVAFSPDGYTLASGDAASTIKVWNLFTNEAPQTLTEHKNWVLSVIFSPDGQTLVSSSHDHTIKFWDIVHGRTLQTLQGHKNDVNAIAFSPDGSIFASGSRDKTIKLWQ